MSRARTSRLASWLVAAALALGALAGGSAHALAGPRVESAGFVVSDLDRSVAFFVDVLDFEKVSETELAGAEWERLQSVPGARMRVARLRLGEEEMELTEYLAPRGRAMPEGSRSHDRWFQHVAIVVSDMGRAYARLRAHRVEHASSGPQRLPDWNPGAGGIEAFYFRDPDGHVLEILSFPPGKGDARWQRGGDGLFLGIDHTAIVSSDTEASLRFWRDEIGLRVAGESENFGVEQEHLNGVFGAHLRITTLRGDAGPGVELLEYLFPRDGRPRPSDARANDLLHWQTGIVVDDAPRLEETLRRARAPFPPGELVSLPGTPLGLDRAALVADPDGHVVRIASAMRSKESR